MSLPNKKYNLSDSGSKAAITQSILHGFAWDFLFIEMTKLDDLKSRLFGLFMVFLHVQQL